MVGDHFLMKTATLSHTTVFISIPSNIQGPYKVVSSTIEALNGLALNENGKASLCFATDESTKAVGRYGYGSKHIKTIQNPTLLNPQIAG
jgi:hypothetical protein